MGETTTCERCGSSIDSERDHHFSLSRTSVDVRDGRKETDERLLCRECGIEHLDATSSESDSVEIDALGPNK